MNLSEQTAELGDLGPLIANQETVESLQRALIAAPRDLRMVCSGLSVVIRTDAWKKRMDVHRGRAFMADSFRRFIADPLPEGLATDEGILRRLLRDEPATLALLEMALDRGPGGANNPHGCKGKPEEGQAINNSNGMVDSAVEAKHSNGMNSSPVAPEAQQGNTVQYAVRRLTKERPDLLERVKAGELSCNAAMIEAGFRKVPTGLDLLRKAWAKATAEEREAFRQEIAD